MQPNPTQCDIYKYTFLCLILFLPLLYYHSRLNENAFELKSQIAVASHRKKTREEESLEMSLAFYAVAVAAAIS